jgi:hypothetical protein
LYQSEGDRQGCALNFGKRRRRSGEDGTIRKHEDFRYHYQQVYEGRNTTIKTSYSEALLAKLPEGTSK